MRNPFLTRQCCALLDYPLGTVLTISTSVPAVIFLQQCTPDTLWASDVQSPNYTTSFKSFFIQSIEPEEYPKWTWDHKTRTFIKTREHLLTQHLMAKSKLAEGKRTLFEIMLNNINMSRLHLLKGTLFGDVIYMEKRRQAKVFKDSGYNEDFAIEFPYVVQYADVAQISLKQAAEDILLKAKFDEDVLSKTELFRLKYLKKLKEAVAPEQLIPLEEEFLSECYIPIT